MDNCYDLIRIKERRLARKERRLAERKAEIKREANHSKKARKCVTCGRWIRKVELFYQGQPQGSAYIHIKTRDMDGWSDGRKEALLSHLPEPRPINK